MIHASFFYWAGAAWRVYGCQKRGLTGAKVLPGDPWEKSLLSAKRSFTHDVSFRHKSRNAPDPWRLIISHRLLDTPDPLPHIHCISPLTQGYH